MVELKVGDVQRVESQPVTTTQLVRYAGASGDFNRIHFDEPYARKNGLSGLLVHGMLTMAIAGRCLDALAGRQAHVEIAEFSSRFLAPVRVGDVVVAQATVRAIDPAHQLHVDLVATVAGRKVLQGEAVLASPAE
ncbi:MAG: dehydratase [Candidimonas sp.]|nr:MAG: dehydratase [Candidimonas sp.]